MVACPRNHFYRTPEHILIIRRPAGVTLVSRAKADHRRDVTNQFNLEAPLAVLPGMQDNALDQPPDDVQCLGAVRAMQGSLKACHPLAVMLAIARPVFGMYSYLRLVSGLATPYPPRYDVDSPRRVDRHVIPVQKPTCCT
jgi:hypothetical protein